MAWSTAATLLARATAGRSHHRGLRLVGRPDPRLGAIVVDHHAPAAYCLPGPRRPVVLTTAAVKVLDRSQLAAVLAHEKAHQDGHHHLLVAAAAAPAAAFPLVPAFRLGRDQVARLAELAADDNAAAASPRLAVAGALLALAAPPAGRSPRYSMTQDTVTQDTMAQDTMARDTMTLNTAALGAGGATAARIHRMIAAPNPLSRAAVATWTLAVTALIALPLLLLASPVLIALVRSCSPQRY
jgi:Zn-dependent protease with chaperone function